MKTSTYKSILILISSCGIILIISGAENESIFKAIVQLFSGQLLVLIALKLAWITNNSEK